MTPFVCHKDTDNKAIFHLLISGRPYIGWKPSLLSITYTSGVQILIFQFLIYARSY